MDSAADSLLALSNTAVALAEQDAASPDDDRSSSLSELEDAPDIGEIEPGHNNTDLDGDSEAETERLNDSPDKILKKKPFGISPSKLAQHISAGDTPRPEIEDLTDSAISSPAPSDDESLPEEIASDVEDAGQKPVVDHFETFTTHKRKRLTEDIVPEEQERSRRRRTGSVESDRKSDTDTEDEEERRSPLTREPTVEPLEGPEEQAIQSGDEEQAAEKVRPPTDAKGKKVAISTRPLRRRGKGAASAAEVEEEAEGVEDSEDNADVDDAEAAAKSEEEQAKRVAAMDALVALEKHFAVLRDRYVQVIPRKQLADPCSRLYDERIAAINHELAQLAEPTPMHPELLKQLECVRKHRDDKFDVEQKLLVYKIGALKRKSVAERAQIHSAYFQTVRDLREKHLERISEHFYRIQRDRFKAESTVPTYTIPFPERRSQQITQQTAFNKEVSILSGVAKYVGMPAAPDLPASRNKEVEGDLGRMGVSQLHLRKVKVLLLMFN